MAWVPPMATMSRGRAIGSAGTHNAVIPLTVPNPPTDSYQFLNVIFVPNNGQGSQATAKTSELLIQPSIPFAMPTAPNTLVPPFSPTQILTVCPVGCQYTELSQAIIASRIATPAIPPTTC